MNFGDFHALKNINITIPTNKVISIIGPSGCGKSTFLRCLNRMNDLVEGCKITGEILLDGVDINKDMDVNHLRKRVGMVFQKANPFPMSIYDNIAYGPRTHGVKSKAKLDEIVEKSLKDAALWDDVKDRLKKSCFGDVRRPAAEVMYSKSTCGRSGGIAYGRAQQVLSIPYPHQKSKTLQWNLKISILSSW